MSSSAWPVTHYQLDCAKEGYVLDFHANIINRLMLLAKQHGHDFNAKTIKTLPEEDIETRQPWKRAHNQPQSVIQKKRKPVMELENFQKTAERENLRYLLHQQLTWLENCLHFVH